MTGGISASKAENAYGLIEEINFLKEKNDVILLSHYYMSPELQISVEDGGAADVTGDSLALSIAATGVSKKNILFCGVKFMAETALLLNPSKHVFLPDFTAGCSLAESITAQDVIELKMQYPDIPVVAYINTTAESKAECDICCTSRNAVDIINSFDSNEIIFLPDKYMGENLQHALGNTGKKLILWNGSCYVHEQFNQNIQNMLIAQPEAEVLFHWEVPSSTVNDVLEKHQGMLGSTNDIINYVQSSTAKKFILASECDLGSTLKGKFNNKQFITPCTTCMYMKKMNLNNVLETLKQIDRHCCEQEIVLSADIKDRAALPLQRMLSFSNKSFSRVNTSA